MYALPLLLIPLSPFLPVLFCRILSSAQFFINFDLYFKGTELFLFSFSAHNLWMHTLFHLLPCWNHGSTYFQVLSSIFHYYLNTGLGLYPHVTLFWASDSKLQISAQSLQRMPNWNLKYMSEMNFVSSQILLLPLHILQEWKASLGTHFPKLSFMPSLSIPSQPWLVPIHHTSLESFKFVSFITWVTTKSV